MKFTIAVSALAFATSTFAASCARHTPAAVYEYEIIAEGVPNIPDVCGRLWNELSQFSSCVVGTSHSCEERAPPNGRLRWVFSVGYGCDGGAVEAAWWDATLNDYGAIDCP
ncbi:hypothetical protein M011DRAFT_523858 [Sporormia fimetaria CBS 119925]|uniref:Uncharacterized protein n=1 Tax=Sporormia fimetaria CBS 119925 TaxID=1340428 RepID=A0A6A6VMI1_9PLEO|nr:hypothetical protein M011DRAFT_523858 [Sporormia fimetaria CBS 119925]